MGDKKNFVKDRHTLPNSTPPSHFASKIFINPSPIPSLICRPTAYIWHETASMMDGCSWELKCFWGLTLRGAYKGCLLCSLHISWENNVLILDFILNFILSTLRCIVLIFVNTQFMSKNFWSVSMRKFDRFILTLSIALFFIC